MMTTHDDRISLLEERIAFQESAIDQLSDIVASQAKEIDELRRMIMILNDRIKNADSSGNAPVADAPPPHY